MFDTQKVFEIISSQIVLLQKHYESSIVDAKSMLAMSDIENEVCSLRDMVFAKYSVGGLWANEGYHSSKSAIVHQTHASRASVAKSIARGKLLNEFESLSDALKDNLLTCDHVDVFSRVKDSKYDMFLDRDIDLLVENAIKFDVAHFSQIVNYWKNIVDDQLDETPDDYKHFENRRLFLNELDDGSYLLHGVLDKATAMVFKKALEDIANKFWRKDSIDQRKTTSKAAYRADAAGYLGQLYLNATANTTAATANTTANTAATANVTTSVGTAEGFAEFSFTPSISSDIVIDVAQLRNDYSTREYLSNNLSKTSPIHNAHSKNHIKQILCDTELNVIIKDDDASINLGRKVRVAPERIKRILATQTNTCTIEGCSIPASWCNAHHIHHWADGGETKIENLVLLCRRHHTMIHNNKTFMYKASKQIKQFKKRHSCQNKNSHHQKNQQQNHPPPIENTG